jgi:hypothetical protein
VLLELGHDAGQEVDRVGIAVLLADRATAERASPGRRPGLLYMDSLLA